MMIILILPHLKPRRIARMIVREFFSLADNDVSSLRFQRSIAVPNGDFDIRDESMWHCSGVWHHSLLSLYTLTINGARVSSHGRVIVWNLSFSLSLSLIRTVCCCRVSIAVVH